MDLGEYPKILDAGTAFPLSYIETKRLILRKYSCTSKQFLI